MKYKFKHFIISINFQIFYLFLIENRTLCFFVVNTKIIFILSRKNVWNMYVMYVVGMAMMTSGDGKCFLYTFLLSLVRIKIDHPLYKILVHCIYIYIFRFKSYWMIWCVKNWAQKCIWFYEQKNKSSKESGKVLNQYFHIHLKCQFHFITKLKERNHFCFFFKDIHCCWR